MNKFENKSGWTIIKSKLKECPYCKQKPNLGTDAFTGKWQVACFNICCDNMTSFLSDNFNKACGDWNKWVELIVEEDNGN